MITVETLCQCHKCGETFNYMQHMDSNKSPCCHSSYSILDPSLDQFFSKYLDVNNDQRYYEYETLNIQNL